MSSSTPPTVQAWYNPLGRRLRFQQQPGKPNPSFQALIQYALDRKESPHTGVLCEDTSRQVGDFYTVPSVPISYQDSANQTVICHHTFKLHPDYDTASSFTVGLDYIAAENNPI